MLRTIEVTINRDNLKERVHPVTKLERQLSPSVFPLGMTQKAQENAFEWTDLMSGQPLGERLDCQTCAGTQ